MKRMLCISLVILSLLGLTCCASKNKGEEKISVVCTIFPQYDVVRQIAGEKVDLKMLLPYGMESHDYRLENLSARDMQMIINADVFIYVGGESDTTWVEQIKDMVGEKNVRWLSLLEMTDALLRDGLHHEHSYDHTNDHGEVDEHVWTSPSRMLEITDVICEMLVEVDPKNCDAYLSSAEEYKKELRILDEGFKNLNGMNGETLVFADRFPFRYLFNDYHLEYVAAFDGCGTAVDPSALQISKICEIAKSENSKAVYYIENSNISYAKTVADTVGAEYKMLHSCHNVTRREFLEGVTYVSLMQKNLNILMEAAK